MEYGSLMGRGQFPTFSSFIKIFPIHRSIVCGKERVAVDKEIVKKNKIIVRETELKHVLKTL
jgi:hypothetical protein